MKIEVLFGINFFSLIFILQSMCTICSQVFLQAIYYSYISSIIIIIQLKPTLGYDKEDSWEFSLTLYSICKCGCFDVRQTICRQGSRSGARKPN